MSGQWYLLCWLLYLLTNLTSSQMTRGLPGNLSRFSDTTLRRGLLACGWTRFCSVTSHSPEYMNTTNYNTTCCQPCSCDQSCWLLGDCCPDVPDLEIPPADNRAELRCHTNHIALHGSRNLKNKETNFKMITQCPSRYGGFDGMQEPSVVTNVNRTIQMCQEPFGLQFNRSDFSFYDVVPVTGADGIIYKNVHCATCHDVVDVTFWEVQAADCTPGVQHAFPGGVPTIGFLIDQCILLAAPPGGDSDLVVDRARCSEITSECSESEDAELIRACKFSRFPARFPPPATSVYSNIFCLLCANPHKIAFPLNCRNDVVKTVFGSLKNLVRIPLGSDISTAGDSHTPEHYTCDREHIYDTIMTMCRELICPFGSAAVFGTCVSSNFTFEYYYLAFFTKVTLERTEQRISINYFMHIEKEFFIAIGLSSVCQLCSLYSDYNGEPISTFHMSFAVRLSSRCTLDMITSVIVPHKTTLVNFTIQFGGTEMTISQNVSVQLFPVTNTEVIEHMPYKCEGIQLGKLFDCPSIVLKETEYCKWEVISGTSDTSQCITSLQRETLFEFENAIEIFYTDGERQVRMCISRYLEMAEVSVTENSDSLPQNILSLACTCLSMVCTCFAIAVVWYRTRVKSFPLYVLITGMVTHVLAQCFFQFGVDWPNAVYICPIIGMIIHYLWLATVFAFNTYCISVCFTVKNRIRFEYNKKTTFLILNYILLLPVMFVIINVIYSYNYRNESDNLYGYGTRQCFIDSVLMNGMLFVLPILLCVVVNCFVYLTIVLAVRKQAIYSQAVGINRDYASVYFRMLVIAGVTWLLGFLNEFVDSLVLEYVFIIGFGGQGVFLLLAFSSIYRSQSQKETCGPTSSSVTASTAVTANGKLNM